MATTSLQCEVYLAENGDLVRVATITPLRATFGVPEREAVETVPGFLLFMDPGSLNGKRKYALLTSNGKTVVTIGDAAENIKKGVMVGLSLRSIPPAGCLMIVMFVGWVTADGATGEAAYNGEGEWFYFH